MYLVTGGAGFIGSNIVAALEEKQIGPIVVCDRLRSGAKWKNIAKRELADIIHPEELPHFLDSHRGSVHAIFHMGAISATTETDADKIIDNNFKLSLYLWNWCTENHTRFIYASSAATYGDGDQGFIDDTDLNAQAKLRPLNPYGWSKLLFDRRILRKIQDGEPKPPQWAGLKFFNVFGPNEYHKGTMQSVVSHIYPKAAAGEQATLFKSHHPDYEDGGQTRDFVWIGDCIDVMMWLLDKPEVSGIFNCGTGKGRTFLDLAKAVYAALGKEPDIAFVPTPEQIRDKYQYFTEADMSKLRSMGYNGQATPLEEGIRQYVQDYLHTEDPYR